MPPRTPFVDVSNFSGGSDPTASDDANDGWDVGSRWINTSSGKVWYCVDATPSAAVWKDVSTPGAGSHPVYIKTVDPTVNDDTADGYSVGDHWLNTTNRTIWQALDVTLGAAIWDRIDNPKANVTTTNPGPSNDNTQGYEVGSIWVNTTGIGIAFIATDVSTGAARWRTFVASTGDRPKTNYTATTDPTTINDQTQDYSIGSEWVNIASEPRRVFVCVLATTGTAVWQQTNNEIPDNGGLYLLGTLLGYPVKSTIISNEVNYTRVRFAAGTTLSKGVVFICQGAAGKTIRMGLYSQADPTSLTGVPVTRLAESGLIVTTGLTNTYLNAPFGAPYTIPTTGYYWIALVTPNSPDLLVSLNEYEPNFLPRREQTTAAGALPATAGGLSAPKSAVAFAAVAE